MAIGYVAVSEITKKSLADLIHTHFSQNKNTTSNHNNTNTSDKNNNINTSDKNSKLNAHLQLESAVVFQNCTVTLTNCSFLEQQKIK